MVDERFDKETMSEVVYSESSGCMLGHCSINALPSAALPPVAFIFPMPSARCSGPPWTLVLRDVGHVFCFM